MTGDLSYDHRTIRIALGISAAVSLMIAFAPFLIRQPLPKLLALGFFWPVCGCIIAVRIIVGVAVTASPARPKHPSRWRALWKDQWLKERIKARQHFSCVAIGVFRLTMLCAALSCLVLGIISVVVHSDAGRNFFSSFILLALTSILTSLAGGIWLVSRELRFEASQRRT